MQYIETPRRFLNHPRIAAEWEPTIGVIVSYPLNIPHTLIIALAEKNHVFMMASSEEMQGQATQQLKDWQIDLKNITFIIGPHGTDMSWVRDWGPHAHFDEQKTMQLVDPLYFHRTPISSVSGKDPLWKSRWRNFLLNLLGRKINLDNEMPKVIGKHFNQKVLSLPFAFTGGNIFMDGHGNAMSMEILLNENKRLNNVEDEDFFEYCDQKLGLKEYAILPNYEDRGIQHIDCYLKLLDEERLLVLRPPQNHPYSERYDEIIENELKGLKTPYGRPYEILRLDTARFRKDELAAYVNSIMLNKNIYMPMYGIPQDEIALEQWRAAMPGYTVQGFEYDLEKETAYIKKYRDIGWRAGDALHCRTRGVWNPHMLYLSVNRLDAEMPRQKSYQIESIIIDYSKAGLIEESLQLNWRETENQKWQSTPLKQLGETDVYQAVFSPSTKAKNIEYFVKAKSDSGEEETMPRTAPKGFYQFEIK